MNQYKAIDLGLESLGLKQDKVLSRNLSPKDLVSDIIKNGEGLIASSGAAMIDSGEYTGRSPKDKYIVEESSSKDKIWWGEVNQKISEDIFNDLYNQVIEYYNTSDSKTYVFDGFAGADKNHNLSARFIVKKAWQAHFVHNMFIRPENGQLDNFIPDFTIINASDVKNLKYVDHGMNSDAFVIFHLGRKIAIIGGTEYGGEMKKGIFSVMHYLLPQKGILSMHCSANVDNNGKNPALFFGLSGTGKMSKSAGEADCIYLCDDAKTLEKKIKRAKTDAGPSAPHSDMSPEIKNLFDLMALVSTDETCSFFEEEHAKATIRYGDFKGQLAKDMEAFIAPKREAILGLVGDTKKLNSIAQLGKEKAHASGAKTLKEVRKIIGFGS